MLMGADRALRKRKLLPALGAGAALAIHFYWGFTPAAIYYVGALAGYYVVTAWLTAEKPRRISCGARSDARHPQRTNTGPREMATPNPQGMG